MKIQVKAEIMDQEAMKRAVSRISFEILERNKGAEDLCLVGILRRGASLAGMIARRISEIEGVEVPCGVLDATAYRDDRKAGEQAEQSLTNIPFKADGKRIVLVDDVMYTGRTVRAAIDALMDLGRPKNIQLAVLVDRGHRELPIRPDYVGKNLPTSRSEVVQVMVKEFVGEDRVAIGDRID